MTSDIGSLKQMLQSIENEVTNELSKVDHTCSELEPLLEYSMLKQLVEPQNRVESMKCSDSISLQSLEQSLD